MQPQVAINLPSLDITTPGGLVQHGKVMQEFVPGYPQRFAQGDRESPFKPGDFGRYLNIQGKTALLSTAIGALNQKLQIISTTDLAQNHREDIQNMILDHIKNNPKEPLYQQVEAWGGPVAGSMPSFSESHPGSRLYSRERIELRCRRHDIPYSRNVGTGPSAAAILSLSVPCRG